MCLVAATRPGDRRRGCTFGVGSHALCQAGQAIKGPTRHTYQTLVCTYDRKEDTIELDEDLVRRRASPGKRERRSSALRQLVCGCRSGPLLARRRIVELTISRTPRGRRRAALRAGVAMTTWFLDKNCPRATRDATPPAGIDLLRPRHAEYLADLNGCIRHGRLPTTTANKLTARLSVLRF